MSTATQQIVLVGFCRAASYIHGNTRQSSYQWKKKTKTHKSGKHRKELKNINVILYVITQVSALPQVSKNRRLCLFLNVTAESKEQEAQKGENSEVILNIFFCRV